MIETAESQIICKDLNVLYADCPFLDQTINGQLKNSLVLSLDVNLLSIDKDLMGTARLDIGKHLKP